MLSYRGKTHVSNCNLEKKAIMHFYFQNLGQHCIPFLVASILRKQQTQGGREGRDFKPWQTETTNFRQLNYRHNGWFRAALGSVTKPKCRGKKKPVPWSPQQLTSVLSQAHLEKSISKDELNHLRWDAVGLLLLKGYFCVCAEGFWEFLELLLP